MAIGTRRMETAITTTPKPAPAPGPLPSSPAAQPTNRTALLCSAAAFVSGVLLFLCFFPVAWGSYLGWFALTPMLVLVRAQLKPSAIFLIATFGGVVFYLPALSWMRVADRAMVLAWLLLSLYCALYITAGIFCVRALERWKLPIVLTVPMVWTALEFFRSFFLTGFAWYYLAHTQHETLSMIQIADIGGIYIVTFIVAMVNAFLFDWAYQFPEVRKWFGQAELEPYRYYSNLEILNRGSLGDYPFRRNLILETLVVALLVMGTFAYGLTRLSQNRFSPGPVVALLQSNLDQRLRERAAEWNDQEKATKTVEKHYLDLVMVAAAERPNSLPKPDLIIWPETSHPRPWVEISPNFPIEKLMQREYVGWVEEKIKLRERLDDATKNSVQIANLFGMNSYSLTAEGKGQRHNKAVLVSAKGVVEGKYDKMHRVPFGEYVPLKDWLPFLSLLTPYEGDFGIQRGDKFTRFTSGAHRFGVLICYEDTDPFLARRYLEDSDDGKPVDFLVNISNDGWFDGSAEHEEHLAVSRFRAIECRRAMVRAVNMGVSAVIDGNGRVLKMRVLNDTLPPIWAVAQEMTGVPELPASRWSEFKQKSGVVLAIVPIDQRGSLYTVLGDWLPIACWLTLFGCAGWAYYQRRKLAAKPLPA